MNTPSAVVIGIIVGGGIVALMPPFRQIARDGTPWWAKRILNRLDDIVATLSEAVAGWRAYTNDLKAQVKAANDARDVALSGLDAANTAAQNAAAALADFQANDAVTDAQQLSDQAQADADAVQAALDEAKAADVPEVEVPPVVDQPIDGIPLDPPSEPGTGTDIPTGNPPEEDSTPEDAAPAEDAPLPSDEDSPEDTDPATSGGTTP